MRLKIYLVFLSLLSILIWSAVFSLPDGRLHIKFYDVGQGDAALIKTSSNYKLLVDGGPNKKILDYLGKDLPFYDRTIDLVILTHPDSDRLKGLVDVIERYSVKQIWLNSDRPKDTEVYKKFLEIVNKKKIKTGYPKEDAFIDFKDGFKVKVLSPEKSSSSIANSSSIVIWGSLNEFDVLLTGDAGEESQPYSTKKVSNSLEVLKVPHHGAKTSLRESYLKELSPELSVVSVGKNSYGHPYSETLEKLIKVGSQVFRTDQGGSLEVVSDGRSWYTRAYK